jgi:hypothetical protein
MKKIFRIKERNIVILSLLIILSVSAYFIWRDVKPVNYKIEEIIADSTINGKIYFGFVSVDKYDVEDFYRFGREFLNAQITLDVLRKDVPVIAVVQYYDPDDTTDLTVEAIKNLYKTYPNMEMVYKNLQCVEDGYIFTGFSKQLEGIKVPKDTVFATNVIIPKDGIKAKDVLKVTK